MSIEFISKTSAEKRQISNGICLKVSMIKESESEVSLLLLNSHNVNTFLLLILLLVVFFLYNLDPKCKPTHHLDFNQRSGDLFWRWATFSKRPSGLSCNYLTQSLQCERNHRQSVSKWAWLCYNKSLFTKIGWILT